MPRTRSSPRHGPRPARASSASAVQPLLPVRFGTRGDFTFARGVRAGRWLFASGQMGVDYATGAIAESVLRGRSPLSGTPKPAREAERVFDQLEQVLHAGGSDLAHLVRSDQYFTGWEPVTHYHPIRVRRFKPLVAPTTSVLQPRLWLPDAQLNAEFLALTPEFGAPIEAVYPPGLHVPSTSGFAPVVRAGDHVFVAGFMAAHQPGDLGGIAPEARVPEGHLWKGNRIRLETEYAMKEKIAVAVEGAGGSLERVAKLQVYLRDLDDLPACKEVLHRWFPHWRPAISFIPTATPGFAIEDARLEINALALTADGATPLRAIDGGFHTGIDGQTAAVQAGDLLLCSSLLAADEHGLLPGCAPDPRQPFFGCTSEAQMQAILDRAQRLCAQAGTTLANMTRLQLFVTDLAEVPGALRALRQRLPDTPLPLSVVGVPGRLPVPGCTVMAELWVYAPH
jgi:enamine deaminase RidA (YjgF/YER057c/UK114 family)